MPQAKQTSKQKRRSKALPVLGAAGLSLSLAGTASAVPAGPAVNLRASGEGDGNQLILHEEEVADVSLATFYVFDKEGDETSSLVQLVGHGCHGCHGCGGHGCHGCGGCHHGCGSNIRLSEAKDLGAHVALGALGSLVDWFSLDADEQDRWGGTQSRIVELVEGRAS
jgi:hypothetical protein